MHKYQTVLMYISLLFAFVSCSTPDSRLRDSVLEGNKDLRKMYFINVNTIREELKETAAKVGYKTAMTQYMNDRSFRCFKHGILLAYPEKYIADDDPEIDDAILEFCKQKNINYYIADCGTSCLPVDRNAPDGYWIIVKYKVDQSQYTERD